MRAALKRLASYPVAAVILLYEALDALFGPLLRPALRALAALRVFQRIGAAIAAAPPYGVLALLAVPFAAIEPFKFIGLYWLAEGRVVVGAATLAAAHLLSFFVCERIFHAGRERLLEIGWFARFYRAFVDLRTKALDWVKATAAWRATAELASTLRLAVRRALSAPEHRG